MKDRYPAALAAFESLLDFQAPPYCAHRAWMTNPRTQVPSPKAGEVIRGAMIECRIHETKDYPAFLTSVNQNHHRLLR